MTLTTAQFTILILKYLWPFWVMGILGILLVIKDVCKKKPAEPVIAPARVVRPTPKPPATAAKKRETSYKNLPIGTVH